MRMVWKLPAPSFALLALGALIIGLSLTTLAIAGLFRPGLVAEGLWYLAVLWAFSALRPFRLVVAKIPKLQQLALLSFGLALLLGQFLGGGGDTYPVVRWSMYSDPVGKASTVIYEGISRSGDRVLLRPSDLIPSLRNGRFESKLRYAYKSSTRGSLPEGTTELDQLLRSVAQVYNQANVQNPIIAVEVFEYSVPTDSYLDRSRHELRLLWRTEL